jgi:hypothetical protein
MTTTMTQRIKAQDARIPHDCSSPFPMRTAKGTFVVNERCRCGAKRSEHRDTVAYGHGPCPATRCPRFSFDDFVYASDVVQRVLERETAGT